MSYLLRPLAGAALAAVAIAAPAVASPAHHSHDRNAAVYIQTDNPSGNRILAYARSSTGRLTLTLTGTYATGGDGAVASGAVADPLASQGSLVTADRGRVLLAVNAGSNTISVFAVHGDRLTLRQTLSTGGAFPASIAVYERVVYVLNAAGDGSVTGFRLRDGRLHPISNSLRSLGLGNLTVRIWLQRSESAGLRVGNCERGP